eukprot:CAMPEP_0181131258 /NCGR_PEP_ID=MMETSP1071-20121207/30325_1 /TAXON_ID=35127 /ORGANISM="Thalassiosira sp., Strain NH16" /LENGTH=825 /DNA_ID=CAMNT_0023217431 /DNA_START=88 /DNA_END=2565 /DNA_ORIENTATION=+
MNQMLHIPRSLTAPDAWVAIILALYLQYKQYSRQKQKRSGKVHSGAKSKPKMNAAWTLVHECLFTNLHMMVSPFSNQAAALNAEIVNLQSEKDVDSYAKKVASGKPLKNKKTKSGSGSNDSGGKKMEVRSRRIMRGEMLHDAYYPVVEATLNLALSVLVGLASRWLLGLISSLRLSAFSSNSTSLSGSGGPCCSPYRGADDEGSRLPGSFERLLACVLVKQESDNAGTLIFSFLLSAFFAGVMKLAWPVSAPSAHGNDELNDDADNKKENGNSNGTGASTYKRIHPLKAKRFFVGIGASIFLLWLFHTPALLRVLGLDGIIEAGEEWSARVILFGNLLGVFSLSETNTLEESPELLRNLTGVFILCLALVWGYIASGMMTPIEETARNAACILSPSPPSKKGKNPDEMFALINVRMMLLIQAMAPFVIMCTYIFSARFAETSKTPSRGGQMSFSKQYLRNSGLFVRVALSWCFIAASSYTLRPLVQSYLDQATTVASAMATSSEGGASNAANIGRGARTKPAAASIPSDPFNDRYKKAVLTTGLIISFPALVLSMLAFAHLRGGDGSTHPGVGYESQPRGAPRSILPVKGLPPPYSNKYMSWIANHNKPHHAEVGAGNALLEVAALSQSSWDQTPFRDSAHARVVDWLGRNNFCYPPEVRAVKALGRHVNFLLDNDNKDNDEGSILTMNALTGRELLDMSPMVPTTLLDILLRRHLDEITSGEGSCKIDNDNTHEVGMDEGSENSPGNKKCNMSDSGSRESGHISLSEMFSSLASHSFLTPTIVFPIIDMFAFLNSIWWNYWYSITMIVHWIKLRRVAAYLNIAA